MIALERHCRLLLLAYPAAYRRQREAEILGTLLEATPAGRTWPLPRDSRTLVMGGLRARAGLNHRLPAASSLRLAVLFGLSVYLSFTVGNDLSGFAYPKLALQAAPAGWPALPAGVLIAMAVVLAWLARRTAVIAAVLAAGAVTAAYGFSPAPGSWRPTTPVQTVVVLLSLAALTVLAAGADRPPRLWLWLVGLAAATPVASQLPDAIPSATFLVSALPYLTMFMVAVSIAWIGVDARPTVGLAAYLALLGLPNLAAVMQIGTGLPMALTETTWLWIAIVLAVPALWQLHRQAAL
jgi:hypothetical protein